MFIRTWVRTPAFIGGPAFIGSFTVVRAFTVVHSELQTPQLLNKQIGLESVGEDIN